MAKRFTVAFDVEYTNDIEPALVAVSISDLLDADEWDHSIVDVVEIPEEDSEIPEDE